MTGPRRRVLVLALYPFTRGLAFAAFESPLSPIDWGIKDPRRQRKNARTLAAAKRLMERLQPDVVVLLELSGAHGRTDRIRRLQRLIEAHARAEAIDVEIYGRKDIRDCFAAVGAKTRYEIAQAIASQIHAFGNRLPPAKKVWKSEDARMGLFDAASLALTFYAKAGDEPLPKHD